MPSPEQYYDENAEQEWKRLENRRTEFSMVQRALREYMPPPPARVVDIGAGPGRYAVHLSLQGYRVTLVDISSVSLDLARRRTHSRIDDFIQADARNLAMLEDGTFDAALLFGPLYHLMKANDRRDSVVEALRILKPGGVLFGMFMSRYAAFRHYAIHNPERVIHERANLFSDFLHHGEFNQGDDFPPTYNALPSEIRPVMESAGLATETIIGCEGILADIDAGVSGLHEREREQWMDLNYRIAKDPSTHGGATHIVYVGRKK